MKTRLKALLVGLALGAAASTGCSYAGVATTQDNLAVVPRNDGLLFGALRSVYVCQVSPEGLSNCSSKEAP